MSTKLYHAFELRLPTASVAELHGWAARLRGPLQATAEQVVARWIAREAVYRFDQATLAGRPAQNCLFDAFQACLADQRRSQTERGIAVDVEARVEVFFDPLTQGLHGLFYIENEALRTQFLADPHVVRAPYWNNTDPDPSVSEEAWDARAALWDRLLGWQGNPTTTGLGLSLVNWQVGATLDRGQITPYLPCLDERLPRLARERTLNDLSLALQAGGEAVSTRRWVSLLLDSDLRESDAATLASLRQELQPDVTFDDLVK